MTDEQKQIVLANQNLIYMVLKQYHLYNKCDEYYDLGLIGLCKGVKSFDNTRNIKISTYLTRCISNEIWQYLRKKRPNTVSLELNIEENLTLESIIKDDSIDIERDLIIKNDFEEVSKIIKSLPDDERIILSYLYNLNGYEQMTQMELAEYFNTSQAQICRIKNRIISKIRKQLKDNEKTTGGNKKCF